MFVEKYDKPQLSALGYFILGFVVSIIVAAFGSRVPTPVEEQTLFSAAFLGAGFALIDALVFWWVTAQMPLFLSRFLCLVIGGMVALLVRDIVVGYTLLFTFARFIIELMLALVAYEFFVKKFKQKQDAS